MGNALNSSYSQFENGEGLLATLQFPAQIPLIENLTKLEVLGTVIRG
jgi:hypothetical protein